MRAQKIISPFFCVAALTPVLLLAESSSSTTGRTSHVKQVSLTRRPVLRTPGMCKVPQPVASSSYVEYCMRVSPNEHPSCPAGSDQQKAWADSSGYGSYFEVLDCSWHAGQDPRPHSLR